MRRLLLVLLLACFAGSAVAQAPSTGGAFSSPGFNGGSIGPLAIKPNPVVTLNVDQPQASGGSTLLAFASVTGASVGQVVFGFNIPTGTRVSSIVSKAQVTFTTTSSSSSGQKVLNYTGAGASEAVGQQCVDITNPGFIGAGNPIASIQAGTSITFTNNLVTTVPSGDTVTCDPTITMTQASTATLSSGGVAFYANATTVSTASSLYTGGDASVAGNLNVGGAEVSSNTAIQSNSQVWTNQDNNTVALTSGATGDNTARRTTIITTGSASPSGHFTGFKGQGLHSGTGTITAINGIEGAVENTTTGTITQANSFLAYFQGNDNAAGTITTYNAFYAGSSQANSGTITTSVDFYSPALTWTGNTPATQYTLKNDDPNKILRTVGPTTLAGTVTIPDGGTLTSTVDTFNGPIAINQTVGACCTMFNGLFPSLGASSFVYMNIGKANSTNDSGGVGFDYIGSGSTSNALCFEFFGGGCKLTVTAAGNATLTGNLTAAGLATAGTIAGSICATSGGLLLYESGATGCTISLEELKQYIAPLSVESATSDIMALKPISYSFKDPKLPGTRLGFGAHQVHDVDPLLSTYDGKGDLQAYEPNAILAETVAVVQKQQAEIDAIAAHQDKSADDPLTPLKAKIDEQQLELAGFFVWCVLLSCGFVFFAIKCRANAQVHAN